VIILGDLNAYAEEDPIDVLRAAGFINLFGPEVTLMYLTDTRPLDHALVTSGLAKQFAAGGNGNINADEPIFLGFNTEFKNPSTDIRSLPGQCFPVFRPRSGIGGA
jgi:predicted extracellular nuclease